ncbi:tissue factor-like [Paralichthys olivaceus]|uniref:tissue factor-like n=2 Tax=Paralichthys olivaceus TaxID=8255 RepID=UPI003753C7DA
MKLVKFYRVSGNNQRTPHCIRTTETVCDLSSSLTDLNAYYTADVLSETPRGATTDLIESPHTSTPRFCPYKDTEIGKPDFKLEVIESQKKTTLYVTDPLTALFKDGHQLNIRDIFADQLHYKVTVKTKALERTGVELPGLRNTVLVSGVRIADHPTPTDYI